MYSGKANLMIRVALLFFFAAFLLRSKITAFRWLGFALGVITFIIFIVSKMESK